MAHTVTDIVRSRRRTLALIVTQDARLVVRAPLYTPLGYIQRFVDKKSSWIDRKMREVTARVPSQLSRGFSEGEKFPYLGRDYTLCIVDDAGSAFSFDDSFRISRSHHQNAKELFAKWYKSRAISDIGQRLDRYSASLGIKYDKFNISSARTKWGSCARRSDLRFNWRLVMAPDHVIDYVVVHELAHIEIKNHSKRFWQRVAELFPGYIESRRWLKENGHLLTW